MLGESSFLPPGRVFFEQGCYPGYQLFEYQQLLQNGVPMPEKPIVDQNGNNQAYLRPISNGGVNEGIYENFFEPQKHPVESNNLIWQPPQFPACYQGLYAYVNNTCVASSWAKTPQPNAEELNNDVMFAGSFVSENQWVDANNAMPYSSLTTSVSERGEYFPTKTMCSWFKTSHEMIPHEVNVTFPEYASAPVQGTQTWSFAQSTNETQRNHEISRCFVPPYFGNVWPQVGSSYSEHAQFITNKNYMFNEPESSRVVSRALYPEQENVPLPPMFLHHDQFRMPDPYLPAYEGIENSQVFKGSSNPENFSAPQFGGMAVPYCYTSGKLQHVANMEATAFYLENSSRVADGQPQAQEVEPVAGKFCEPDIALNQQYASAASSVSHSDVTCPNASEEVRILKIATISPRPGSNHPIKPKDKFAVILKKNERPTRKESEIAKPLDLGYNEQQYDLANAQIFQILCEITTV